METQESTQKFPVLTVSQLTHAIKMCLEGTFPYILTQGEISNLKIQSSGHLYFSLKDPNAQIAAVMFRRDASTLIKLPKEGDHVIIKGQLNVYPPKGNYQIIVQELTQVGLGELLLRLEQLKIKMQQKGFFAKEHKKPLPKFPKKIGVVTSPTGAVIQDILHILTRRFSGFHLILNPVKVQGEGAAQEIAQAIDQFNQWNLVDVMIVGRGGGSIEDLWAFNEEVVAEAIFRSHIPIISAVGHETDHCIADYVADMRAPTPSAAAEMVIAEKSHQMEKIQQFQKHFEQSLKHILRQSRQQIVGIMKHPLFASSIGLLGPWMQKMDDYRLTTEQTMLTTLSHKKLLLQSRQRQAEALRPTTQILHSKNKLSFLTKSIQSSIFSRLTLTKKDLIQKSDAAMLACRAKHQYLQQFFQRSIIQKRLDQLWLRNLSMHKERLQKLRGSLKAIDPKSLLAKGYSILFAEKDHSVINSVENLIEQQNFYVLLSDGKFLATVKEKLPNE